MRERDNMSFGEKEKRFLKLCIACPPDVEAVRRFLSTERIDINATDDDDNLLSSFYRDFGDWDNDCWRRFKTHIIEITRLFLDHGFDVCGNGGEAGAWCMTSLMFNHDGDELLQTAALLLEAGLDPCYFSEEEGETLLDEIWFEHSVNDLDGDHPRAEYTLRLYNMMKAAAESCPQRHPVAHSSTDETSA